VKLQHLYCEKVRLERHADLFAQCDTAVVLTRCSHFSPGLGIMHDFFLILADTRF